MYFASANIVGHSFENIIQTMAQKAIGCVKLFLSCITAGLFSFRTTPRFSPPLSECGRDLWYVTLPSSPPLIGSRRLRLYSVIFFFYIFHNDPFSPKSQHHGRKDGRLNQTTGPRFHPCLSVNWVDRMKSNCGCLRFAGEVRLEATASCWTSICPYNDFYFVYVFILHPLTTRLPKKSSKRELWSFSELLNAFLSLVFDRVTSRRLASC